jgi:hypothetical protein
VADCGGGGDEDEDDDVVVDDSTVVSTAVASPPILLPDKALLENTLGSLSHFLLAVSRISLRIPS